MFKELSVTSTYLKNGERVKLPERMAKLVDTGVVSLNGLINELSTMGGKLYLSDAYRDRTEQQKAREDYETGKKKAFSPPPGYSYHEAGRAIDIDLDNIGMPLKTFWSIARKYGWTPVIPQPVAKLPEAWHFEFREYWGNLSSYTIGKRCAVLEAYVFTGGPMSDKDIALLKQGYLTLLGFYKGALDGSWGPISKTALAALEAKIGPIGTDIKTFSKKCREILLK